MKQIESLKQILREKVKELDNLIVQTEKSLKKAPKGSLVLSSSNGITQYYHKTNSAQKKGKYITTKNKDLAYALAQKDYDLQFLQFIEEQKSKICRAIQLLPDQELIENYSKLSDARKALVKPHIQTDEQYMNEWLNVPYTGKGFVIDSPEIITERGERVRSKTEKILADKLYAMGVPYRYEFPVILKGYGTIYPDFTLLNINTRKDMYLEHFGMMDNPEYAQKAILKLETYAKNHIYLGKGLLVTYETQNKPLDMRVVEQMIKEFVA